MSGTGLVLLAALLVSCLALLMDTTSAGLERWCSSSSMHAASPKGRCGKELADAVDMLCRIQGQPLGRGKRAAIEAGSSEWEEVMQASDGDESHLPASAHISPAIKRMSALLPWSQEDMRQLPLKDVDAGWSEETAEDSEDASNEANSSNTESESSEDSSSSSSHVFLNRQSALSMFKRSQPLIRTRGVEKQGIVCECCWHSCSLPELAQYCTGPAPPTTRTTLVTPTTRVTRAAKRPRKGKGGSGRVLQGGQGGKKTTKPFLFPTPSPQKQPRRNPYVQASTPASVLPLPLS